MEQMIQVLQTLVYTGFGMVVLWTYFGMFLQERVRSIWSVLYWIPFLSWQILWGMLLLSGNPTSVVINPIISILVTIPIAVIGYTGSLKKKIIFSISFMLVGMVSEELVWYSVQFWCAPGTNSTAWWPPILAKVLSLVLILVLFFMLRKKNMVQADERANQYLLVFTGANMFVAYSVTLAYDRLGSRTDSLVAVFTILILLLMTIFVYMIYGKIWENIELKKQNEKYEFQMDMIRQRQKEREENEQELRRFRHDQKQKLAYLMKLAEDNQSKDIVQFLQAEMNVDTADVHPVIKTGNRVIDAILNDKYKKALVSGVVFDVNLDIPPVLPYKDSDLCVVLGNLLDNAFEATIKVKQKRKYIKTTILFDRNNLIISVENSFDGNLNKGWDGHLISSKKDRRNHGIGLKSVRKITEKYGGDVYIEHQAEMFKVKVVWYE